MYETNRGVNSTHCLVSGQKIVQPLKFEQLPTKKHQTHGHCDEQHTLFFKNAHQKYEH